MADIKSGTPQDKDTDSMPDSLPEADDSLSPDLEEALKNKPAAARKKRSAGPWVLLAIIFIALPAAWVLSPPEIKQQALALLKQSTQQSRATQQASEATQTPTATASGQVSSEQVVTNQTAAEPVATEPLTNEPTEIEPAEIEQTATETPEVAATPAPTAEQQQIAALQDEIARLNDELNSMRSKQAQLARKLNAPETIELRVWLGLLASPEPRLSQRSLMWAYLASRPALNDAERERAQATAGQLKQAGIKLGDLRNGLQQLAAGIPETIQANIIPTPENPYFAWLVGTFHLRHAPGPVEQRQSSLRAQLLDMDHALSIEDWPEPRAWRQLANAISDQFGDAAAAEIPGTLDDIRMDIEASRKQATDWKETL